MDAVTGTKEWFAKSKERFEEARENEAIKRQESETDTI